VLFILLCGLDLLCGLELAVYRSSSGVEGAGRHLHAPEVAFAVVWVPVAGASGER